jgi:hypothetical protein
MLSGELQAVTASRAARIALDISKRIMASPAVSDITDIYMDCNP